jgi:hypothetical protein
MFLVLFLLSNASLINNVLAIACWVILVFDFLVNHKKEEWKGMSKPGFAAGVVFVLVGMTLSAIAVLPEEDNMFNPSISGLGNAEWIAALTSRSTIAFFLFRDIDRLPRWMIISEIDIRKEPIGLHASLSLVFLALTSIALLRKPLGLLFYWAATLGLLFIYGLTFLTAVRYMGHLFVAWVAAFWLSEFYRSRQYKGVGESLAGTGLKMRSVFITLVLLWPGSSRLCLLHHRPRAALLRQPGCCGLPAGAKAG